MRKLKTSRLLNSTVAAMLLCLGACGGGSADPSEALETAKEAVQAGDHEAALASFKEVTGNTGADAGTRYQAMRDSVACEAYVNGDEGATGAWEALKKEFANRLDVDTMAKVGQDVASAGCTDTAMIIIEVATAKAGDDATAKNKLQVLGDMIAKAAAATGDNATLERLKSLGYVGN